MESFHERHIIETSCDCVDCPSPGPQLHLEVIDYSREQWSIGSIAAIAISLILHCIPQKLIGIESEATDKAAAHTGSFIK